MLSNKRMNALALPNGKKTWSNAVAEALTPEIKWKRDRRGIEFARGRDVEGCPRTRGCTNRVDPFLGTCLTRNRGGLVRSYPSLSAIKEMLAKSLPDETLKIRVFCSERIPFVILALGRALRMRHRESGDARPLSVSMLVANILDAEGYPTHEDADRQALSALDIDDKGRSNDTVSGSVFDEFDERKLKSLLAKHVPDQKVLDAFVESLETLGYSIHTLGPYVKDEKDAIYFIATDPRYPSDLSLKTLWGKSKDLLEWSSMQLKTIALTIKSIAKDAFFQAISILLSFGMSNAVRWAVGIFIDALFGAAAYGAQAALAPARKLAKQFVQEQRGAPLGSTTAGSMLEVLSQLIWTAFSTLDRNTPQVLSAITCVIRIEVLLIVSAWISTQVRVITNYIFIYFGPLAASKLKRSLPSFLYSFIESFGWCAGALKKGIEESKLEMPSFLNSIFYDSTSKVISHAADTLFPVKSKFGGSSTALAAAVATNKVGKLVFDAKETLEKIARSMDSALEASPEQRVQAIKDFYGYDASLKGDKEALQKSLFEAAAYQSGTLGAETAQFNFSWVGIESDTFWVNLLKDQRHTIGAEIGALNAHASLPQHVALNASTFEALREIIASAEEIRAIDSVNPGTALLPAFREKDFDSNLLERSSFVLRASARVSNWSESRAPSLPRGFGLIAAFTENTVKEVGGGFTHDAWRRLASGASGRRLMSYASLEYIWASGLVGPTVKMIATSVSPLAGALVPLAYNALTFTPEITKRIIPVWTAAVGSMHAEAQRNATGQMMKRGLEQKPQEAWEDYEKATAAILKRELRLLDSLSRESKIEADIEGTYSHIITSFERARKENQEEEKNDLGKLSSFPSQKQVIENRMDEILANASEGGGAAGERTLSHDSEKLLAQLSDELQNPRKTRGEKQKQKTKPQTKKRSKQKPNLRTKKKRQGRNINKREQL